MIGSRRNLLSGCGIGLERLQGSIREHLQLEISACRDNFAPLIDGLGRYTQRVSQRADRSEMANGVSGFHGIGIQACLL